MLAISILLGLLAALMWLPSLSDLVSLTRVRRAAPRRDGEGRPLPRLLFLVPAHNEELLLPDCLRSLAALDYPADAKAVVVVADNCTDGTAEIARAHRVQCLERSDPVNRGKPYAIAWALERLPLDEYDCVFIIDGDATVDPQFARAMARIDGLADKAVQGNNGISNPSENALTRMSAVFGAARYQFAYPLKQAAGLSVPLQGCGMGVGTRVLKQYGWQAFSICEDWEMYALLTAAGVRCCLAPDARTYAQEASSLHQSASQRRRWTGGKYTVLVKTAPVILRSNASWHQKLDAIAELVSPGPVVHLGTALVLSAGALLAGVPGAVWLAAALLGSLIRTGIYTVAGLWASQERGKALLSFLYLPIYAVWRLGIQVTSFGMVGSKPWVRTRRHLHYSDS